jgi:hypothetical protein
MARIEYRINRDKTGGASVVATVIRVDPGDEVLIVTDTPNATVRWNDISPFAPPAAEEVYVLPNSTVPSVPLTVVRSIEMVSVADCGEKNSNGDFTAWPGASGFPNPGGTSVRGS